VRTVSNVARCNNRDFVDQQLEAIFVTRTTAEWLQRLARFNVPSAAVQDLNQALRHDPQVRHNNTIVEVEHPTAGTVETLALPINFHGTPAEYGKPPPRLGEHSVEVLREFGFNEEEVDALLASQAIAGMNLK
jgi:crotonobetainyl-CoA:carnitine CoA-transferase CaiB-like acyl-CoA transferase